MLDPVFRSKIDLWLIAFIIAIPVLVLEFVFEGSGVDDSVADQMAIGACALVLLFVTWLYFSTSYTVTREALLVKSGPFSWVVPLGEISSIEPTHNPSSSPALSLDRLRIRYGSKEILVSPADKAGFVTAIKRNVNATRDVS